MSRTWVRLLSLGALASGCLGDVSGVGEGTFAVDAFPPVVNRTPLSLTGTKPQGSAILVDGAERVPADSEKTWRVELALVEGPNHFTVGPTSGGVAGATRDVDVELDTTAPRVTQQTPAPGTTGVALNSGVEVLFSEAVDCAPITGSVFSIRNVNATLSCTSAGSSTSARLSPAAPLAADTSYTVLLLGAGIIKDKAGNALASDLNWTFTTGSSVDTTPPTPPTFDSPAPPQSPTTLAQVQVGGSKESLASVEFRWSVDSQQVQGWTELVGKTAGTGWTGQFDLNLGSNLIELRSVDLAQNTSSTVSFTLVRQQNTATVNPPTLDAVVTPTTVGNQVLTGTKPANTSVWNGSTQLVPSDASTSWTALVTLSPGANSFDLVAKDGSGNSSAPAPKQTIQFNPPGAVSGGELKVELEVRDMWDFIGDEFVSDTAGNDLDHYGIDVWIEGPLTKTATGYERCVFDSARRQRKHVRYVASASHSRGEACVLTNPECRNGFFWEPNYRSPNYLAALIESKRWNTAPTTPNPFILGDPRRDPSTGEQWPNTMVFSSSAGHNVPQHPQLFFAFNTPCCGWVAKPKILQMPYIDGVTEASTNAKYSPSTRVAQNGAALGTWTQPKTYRWNLKDFGGNFVAKGPYLVQVSVTLDRARPAHTGHYAAVLATDRETCWDDPAHADLGPHRAEGIIEIDGATAKTVYWAEKAKLETVDACKEGPSTMANRVRCNCGTRTVFPCPALPNSKQGQRVLYLTPDKFTDPADSQKYPVKVQYCPAGACP